MSWRDYEIYITRHFQKIFPDAAIRHDVKQEGLLSKTQRQIDILIEGKIAGFNLKLVVDCKYFNKKIDVKQVDSFVGFLADLKASKGILITNKGYSPAAYNRAMYDTRDIELRIIDFKDLEAYQGFIAVPYFGKHGAVISTPDGWVVDSNPPVPHQLAALYPAGLSVEEALNFEGYISFSYSIKNSEWPNLEHLLAHQEANIRNHYSNPRLEYGRVDIGREDLARIRYLEADEIRGTTEETLFIDSAESIVFLTLLSPTEKFDQYQKKLHWVAEKMIHVQLLYDSNGQPMSAWPVGQVPSCNHER